MKNRLRNFVWTILGILVITVFGVWAGTSISDFIITTTGNITAANITATSNFCNSTTCYPLIDFITDTTSTITDTNASTECSGAEVLLGNATCWDASLFPIDTTSSITDTNASTECSDGEYLDGGNSCYNFNDSVKNLFEEEQVVYNATNIVTETGTLDAGDIDSIKQLADGDTYNVSEVSGTPGFLININFTGVLNFNTVALRGRYDGGSGHTLAMELYRVGVGWEEREEVTDQMNFGVTTFPVFIGGDFIDALGTVRFRINHDDSGITSHDYFLDAVFIGQVPGLVSGGDLADLTGREDACVLLPDVFCKDGSKNMTGDLNVGGFNLTNSDSIFSDRVCNATTCYTLIDFITDTTGAGADTWKGNFTFYWNKTQVRDNINLNITTTNNNINANVSDIRADINSNATTTNNNINLNLTAGKLYTNVNIAGNVSTYVLNNTAGWHLNITKLYTEQLYSTDWSNVSITISQLTDLITIYNNINLNASNIREDINSNVTTINNNINLNLTAGKEYATININANASTADTWVGNFTFYYNKTHLDNNFSLYYPKTAIDNNLSLYLLLAGGTMSGTLDMNTETIDNVGTLNTDFISATNFTGEIKMENQNITYIDCLVFNSGGRICSS